MNDKEMSQSDTNIFGYLQSEGLEKGSSDSEESHISELKEPFTYGGNHKLWNSFQMAAISIAQLYKSCENLALLYGEDNNIFKESFQNASLAITSLYKESIESQQKKFELGFQVGQKKRIKELYAWLNSAHGHKSIQNKKCNYFINNTKRIRKEELLAYLEYLDLKSGFSHHTGRNTKLSKNYFNSPRRTYFSSSPSPSPNSVRSRVSFDNNGFSPFRINKADDNSTSYKSVRTPSYESGIENFAQALNMNDQTLIQGSVSPSPQENIVPVITQDVPRKRIISNQPQQHPYQLQVKKQKRT